MKQTTKKSIQISVHLFPLFKNRALFQADSAENAHTYLMIQFPLWSVTCSVKEMGKGCCTAHSLVFFWGAGCNIFLIGGWSFGAPRLLFFLNFVNNLHYGFPHPCFGVGLCIRPHNVFGRYLWHISEVCHLSVKHWNYVTWSMQCKSSLNPYWILLVYLLFVTA